MAVLHEWMYNHLDSINIVLKQGCLNAILQMTNLLQGCALEVPGCLPQATAGNLPLSDWKKLTFSHTCAGHSGFHGWESLGSS